MAEEALDEVATFVVVLIEYSLHRSVAFRRNDRFDVRGMQIVGDGIAVVGLVGTHRAWI